MLGVIQGGADKQSESNVEKLITLFKILSMNAIHLK